MIRKLFLSSVATALLSATSANAIQIEENYSPSAFVGVGFAIGGGQSGIGFSLRILSSNEPDTVVGAAGVTYYPWAANNFGFDLGLGYVGDGFAGTITYDFMQNLPVISFGATQTPNNPQMRKVLLQAD